MLDRLAHLTGSSDHVDAVARAGMFATPVVLLGLMIVKLLA